MDVNQINKILDLADLNRGQIVPCFIGPPGIGKTQSVYQWAKDKDRNVVEIILSQCLPTEISGLVMPDNESNSMQVFDHARLSSLKDGDILFFDELLEAPPMVLSACLTLIQERRMMSGKKLPDILIVAATNPTASPTLSKLSLRQRFMFFNVEFNKSNYERYIKKKYDVPLNNIIDYIKLEGDSWNVLTPRTLEKLISLGISIRQNGSKLKFDGENAYKKYINELLEDAFFTDSLCDAVFNRDPFTQMNEAICEALGHLYYEENIKDMDGVSITDIQNEVSSLKSVNEVMEYLEEIKLWEKVSEYLEKIDLR